LDPADHAISSHETHGKSNHPCAGGITMIAGCRADLAIAGGPSLLIRAALCLLACRFRTRLTFCMFFFSVRKKV
jgi:hypothetical protein